MRVHHRSPLSPRPAFTLVELMVVIVIVGVLAALTILIFPKLQDSQRVAKGGDVVQGQLFLAKQMALRDGIPRGVRLIQDPTDLLVYSLQLIEQPLPYSTGVVTAVTTTAPFIVTLSAPFAAGTIQPGDFLDLTPNDGYTKPGSPHALHFISAVPTASALVIATAPSLPPVPATGYALPFRVVRGPRPAIGINPVALPTDVVVDYPGAPPATRPMIGGVTYGSLGLPMPPAPLDILFDPSGKVLGTAGVSGKVVLWVYDPTNGTPEQTLVAVYTRTGSIVAQPVNVAGPNPYSFVMDGATSGM